MGRCDPRLLEEPVLVEIAQRHGITVQVIVKLTFFIRTLSGLPGRGKVTEKRIIDHYSYRNLPALFHCSLSCLLGRCNRTLAFCQNHKLLIGFVKIFMPSMCDWTMPKSHNCERSKMAIPIPPPRDGMCFFKCV